MTADELAAAIRAYVGHPPTPDNPDARTWYIDIDSMASDAEIRELAEGIVRASEPLGSELGSVDA